ncbi:hypothetical protein ACFFK0_01540 [Paenibacillus chartarius]|uniref:Hydrolase n=1 Tax=Paenibacillus chartarius TaxID=747481 RepID=A0ABV6DER5_9BACL
MEKKTFYVTVEHGTILADREADGFEFEIEATEEELDRLQQLFEDTSAAEEATAARGMFAPVNVEAYNNDYDDHLVQVYRMLHKLGTPETKRHIESMNILNAPVSG